MRKCGIQPCARKTNTNNQNNNKTIRKKKTNRRTHTRSKSRTHCRESKRSRCRWFQRKTLVTSSAGSENGRIFKDGRPETSHSFLVGKPQAPGHCSCSWRRPTSIATMLSIKAWASSLTDATPETSNTLSPTKRQRGRANRKKNKVRRKEKERKRREKPSATRSGADQRIGSNDSQYSRWIDVERPV